ncbi:MAG: hypothetical protein AAB221_06585, partial [Bacteroidota bacterium]
MAFFILRLKKNYRRVIRCMEPAFRPASQRDGQGRQGNRELKKMDDHLHLVFIIPCSFVSTLSDSAGK